MTPTLNNQPLTRNMTATAGVWCIRVAKPASIVAPRVSKTWYGNGEADIVTQPGDVVKIKDNAGGYYEVTATPAVVKPEPPVEPRKCAFGTSTPPGGKKLDADRTVHEGATLFRLLDSAGANLDQTGGYEASEIAYFRAINPNGKIIGSILNPWDKDGYDNATDARVRDYVRRNIDWIRQLDIVSGPNEPEIYATRGSTMEVVAVRRAWDTAVDELVKLGVPRNRIAGVEWFRRSLIVEDCAKYEVCTVHTHDDAGDRESFLAGIRQRIGNRPLYATETSWPKREPTPEDQAKGMALTMERAAKFCDGAIYYVGRSDPKEMHFDYVAILNSDGTPRPVMLKQWQTILGRKPQQPTPTTPTVSMTADQRAVFDAINAMREANGLPACFYDETLEAIGQTALDQPGDLMAHPAAAGGRGFGFFGTSVSALVGMIASDQSNEGVIARQKVLNPAHVRVGVGIGDGGFYAVFGV